jgi:hypothetical protein
MTRRRHCRCCIYGIRSYEVVLFITLARYFCTAVALSTKAHSFFPESPKTTQSASDWTRRKWLHKASSSISVALGYLSAPGVAHATPAPRAKGAAELDIEFYILDLIGGNKKEGTVLPSGLNSRSGAPRPPRTLSLPSAPSFVEALLTTDCSNLSCIPIQALLEQLKTLHPKTAESDIVLDLQHRLNAYLDESSLYRSSFYSRSPWQKDDITDEYYFDFTSYALWRTAGDVLPLSPLDLSKQRDAFVRAIGRKILRQGQQLGLFQHGQSISEALADTVPRCTEILSAFQKSGYCAGFRIAGSASSDDDTKIDERGKKSAGLVTVFDALDDDSLAGGASVNCLVSVFEPATLGASLQITGEQSRFIPDYIGPTLAACWEQQIDNSRVQWETYFVDPVYRPNPKDYYPNEQLYQFTISIR